MRKTLALLFLAISPLHADDDLFRERFADPATRTAALAELVPGTAAAYFHTALAHQTAGRDEEYRKTIAEWNEAIARKDNPVRDDGMAILENRQLVKDYEKNPVQGLKQMIEAWDLSFDDSRPNAAAAAQSLPTRIDPSLVSEESFEKQSITHSTSAPYTNYLGVRRLKEIDQVESFDEAKTLWLLDSIDRADLPGVVALVDKALGFGWKDSFGTHRVLKELTSEQMVALLNLRPDLKDRQDFVMAYLSKLLPGSETDFSRDRQALASHLRACRDFVLPLSPVHNSLKAHVLYHHLRVEEEAGNYPKEDFLAFLALPRSAHGILRVPDQPGLQTVNLSEYFGSITGCPEVQDDSSLILSYLDHFLGQSDSAADFTPYLREADLSRIHARARLMAGGDAARWGMMLDPAAFKSLLEESVITFSPGAPFLMDSDAAVSLSVDLKNIPDALVRIYEIDVPTYLTDHRTEPEVSIDLDGLVPHFQRSIHYTQAPMLKHRESIDLPELKGAGTWLVDITGGQMSARSLIRKGRLIAYPERTTTGQTVRVFNESNQSVTGATLQLGQETFTADAEGKVFVPNAPDESITEGILKLGKLAVPVSLGSRAEDLTLKTLFHLDREQLLAEKETSLQMRVRLTNHGMEIPLDRIKNPALVMKAELLGGISTERVLVQDLKLKPSMEIPFQVPADLLSITFTLRGTLVPETGGDPIRLNNTEVYQINDDLKGSRVGAAFFSPTREGHRLEVRGRNGEPLASRTLIVEAKRDDYARPVEIEVRTDDNGQVDLGQMDTFDSLEVSGTEISKSTYRPSLRTTVYTKFIQISAGKEIRLPLLKPLQTPTHLELSLVETRSGTATRDQFSRLSTEGSELVIRDLPPGSFRLTQGERLTEIHVSPAPEKDGLLVSASRIQSQHVPASPTILSTTMENGELALRLRGTSPDTRVTLVGKRYLHQDWDPGNATLLFHPAISDTLAPGFTGNGYLTDRKIGDEMRYILDRRAARIFPGTLLPRPGLLLNRWNDKEIHQFGPTGEGEGGGVSAGLSSKGGRSPKIGTPISQKKSSSGGKVVTDFLHDPAVVKFDLKPDSEGVVRLPLADFERSQFIEIVVADLFAQDTMILPLPASETPLRDRRIARPLDSQGHFLASRSAAVLKKDEQVSIENLLDADWRAFTTLGEAHQLLYGMVMDEPLRMFTFITFWPELSEENKLALLGEHACHELHLFLARRDRPFFDKFVKPMLEVKGEPQFMDDYLLGRNLSGYLKPLAWEKLNAAEKALLSQAMPGERERVSRALSNRWETSLPTPDADNNLFAQTLRGTDLAIEDSLGLERASARSFGTDRPDEGVAEIQRKLKTIIIPEIDFEDVSIAEVVDFLRMASRQYDTSETNPTQKGVKFTLVPGVADFRVQELRVRNIPLDVALKYIVDSTKLRYRVTSSGVRLTPMTESGERVITRVFEVPPDFSSSLDSDADPFAEPSGQQKTQLTARKPIKDLLSAAGIVFPEGSSAILSASGKLVVTSTESELDKVEQLAQNFSNGRFMPQSSVDPFRNEVVEEDAMREDVADPFSAPMAGAVALRPDRPEKQAYGKRTKLWEESNYYRHSGKKDKELIPLNRFWMDLTKWDGQGPFLSPHFNECNTTVSDALMCLALLDLPFTAERPDVTVDESMLRVKAREPMLLFYKDTRSAAPATQDFPLLARQTFTPSAQKVIIKGSTEEENRVTGDFRPGVAYSASLILTNPTGTGRRVDLLAQIPAGSIPLKGKPATHSSTHELKPYGVVMEELEFYFPAAGEYTIYPLHVSSENIMLVHTPPRTLRVSNDPGPQEEGDWSRLMDEGSNDEVLKWLATGDARMVDLPECRWRLKDPAFFVEASRLLRENLSFHKEVSSYGFLHNDQTAMGEYLEDRFATTGELGAWLDSPLLKVRPRDHLEWENMEFDPLINPRAHRFTSSSRLNSEAAKYHYHNFLVNLGWKPELDANDLLGMTVFLLMQDRTEEALARFDQIDPTKLVATMNYDYVRAVVLFHRENPAEAKEIASRYLQGLPPGLWKDRFQEVSDQADEIASLDQPDETEAPETLPEPVLDLTVVDGGKLAIKSRSTEKTTIQLFSVDLEVLFTKNPFLQENRSAGSKPSILPNATFDVEMSATTVETTVELPETLRKGNILVSARSGFRKVLKILDSSAMELRQSAATGTLQIVDTATGKPLPKTYIKIYVEDVSGTSSYYKDGYTDLRGKFDYLSHTGVDVSTVRRIAVLASHPEKGARTAIYDR